MEMSSEIAFVVVCPFTVAWHLIMTPYLFIIICFLCHELAQRKQEIAGFTLISSQQISVCYSLQSPTHFKNAFYALHFSVHHFNLPVTQSTWVCFTVKKKMQHYHWQCSSHPSSQDRKQNYCLPPTSSARFTVYGPRWLCIWENRDDGLIVFLLSGTLSSKQKTLN